MLSNFSSHHFNDSMATVSCALLRPVNTVFHFFHCIPMLKKKSRSAPVPNFNNVSC